MPWIESHSELRDHPKSKRMKRKLRISEHETVGLLHYFWYWALEFAPDGDITNLSDEDIADGCRFTGEPEEFVSALIHAGFVDEIDGFRIIHDWFKHAGKLIAWRQKEAERARVNREKNGKKPVNTHSVQRTDGVRTEDDLRTNRGTYVPVTVTDTKDIKHIVDSDECAQTFETFWTDYPKKNGKAEALKKWAIYHKKGEISIDAIMDGLNRYLNYIDHERKRGFDRQYMDGKTFVNQKQWESEWKLFGVSEPKKLTVVPVKPKPTLYEVPPEHEELLERAYRSTSP